MNAPPRRPSRSLTAIDGAIALVAILLIVQMWLLTATLEGYLGGHHGLALPAMILSAVLFAAAFALYRFIARLDRSGC